MPSVSKSPDNHSLSIGLQLHEECIVKMMLEFLETRGLHITQLSLERETGIINGNYSDDLLFLRQLILDGQWDNALDFVEPLKGLETFDFRNFKYNVTKYKFFELLCVKLEPGPLQDNDFAVEELVECLKELEHVCSSPEEYRQLCALLTLPKLSDHADFNNWNPSSARIECFHKIHDLVYHLLPSTPKEKEKSGSKEKLHSANDRLVGLIAKGVFYEGCVDYCQARAIGDSREIDHGPLPTQVLPSRPRLSSTDLSLISWLEMVGPDQFAMPFQQKHLDLKIEHIKKPKLEAQWTEQIMATPIKPGNSFPHSMIPKTQMKFAQKISQTMSMSLMPMQMAASTFINKDKLSKMSQSTAPGFCLGIRDAGSDAMVQSQLIDNMMELSLNTKSSRPDGNKFRSAASPNIQTNFAAPQTLAPAMVQSMMAGSVDFGHVRRDLEEITRRTGVVHPSTMRQSVLPSVPEIPTPQSMSREESDMTRSRLFVEFANKQSYDPHNRHSSPHMGYPNPNQMPPSSHHYDPIMGNQNGQHMYPPQMTPSHGMMGPIPGTQMGQMGQRPMSMPPQLSPNVPPMMNQMVPQQMNQPGHVPIVPSGPIPVQQPMRPNLTSANISTQFLPVCRYEDSQAIRATAFHPSGKYYALGTNSKQLHICKYPQVKGIRKSDQIQPAEIVLSRSKQHRGSVYCASFNATGELLATGSNDKTLRLMAFNADTCKIGAEMEFGFHDGTIRDIVFLDDTINRTCYLVSGGAGNCHINLTDCNSGQLLTTLRGHSAPILGLYTWDGRTNFVSCSQDKTIRFWDIRTNEPVNIITPATNKSQTAPVTSVCVDPSGQVLVSGHEDASVVLYDINGGRVLQTFRPHGDEVRTVRLSNAAYYLLSASYDKRIVITDMRGDLMAPLMYLPVAEHTDKIIQCSVWRNSMAVLSKAARLGFNLAVKQTRAQLPIQVRHGGHGPTFLRKGHGQYKIGRGRDMFHFYFFCLGIFPPIALLIWAHIVYGPCQLTDDSGDGPPPHNWQYQSTPLRQWWAKYFGYNPVQNYEMRIEYWNEIEGDQRMKKIFRMTDYAMNMDSKSVFLYRPALEEWDANNAWRAKFSHQIGEPFKHRSSSEVNKQ
ncbi:hypothetical protein WR25_11345 [Diploscapter pachys]|uniref:CTLH domain-containing protein n=1 Tax=Diploscapter pachys TaxID=2018661 RepID=A0A2A2LI37_9BILA|nr:hypothetical protein WR25_11345 [Diploscapter pachys]